MPARLILRFLGEPRVFRDGAALSLPQSRKTRALLAYLAITGRRHRRDRLCSLLWELPDDPRGALRWSLSKLRAVVDEPEYARIVSDRESVVFNSKGTWVDLIEIRQLLSGNLDTVETRDLLNAAAAFGGDFLEGLDLTECHEFHAWCIAERAQARAFRARVLEVLVDRLKGQPEAALDHARALVELQGHDELAWANFVRLLAAAGRRREAEDQCAHGLRVLDEAGNPATGPLQKVWRNLRKSPPSGGVVSVAARSVVTPTPSAPHIAIQPRWPSVGILPLKGLGDDPVIAHLAYALTEDLMTSLSRDRSMAVVAHAANAGKAASATELRNVAGEIGAQYLVAGSVRRAENTLVVAVRLIDMAESKHLWGERSVLKLDATLHVEDHLARKIAAAIRVEIEMAEARKAQDDPSGSLDVRASYHLGLREMYRFTEAGLVAAQSHFERAVRLDPDFAALHARLAYVHIQRYWYGSLETRDRSLESALDAARRAIELDHKDALGHFSMGRVHALRRHFDDAMPELETAIRLDPTMAQAHFGLGQATSYAGHPKDAARLLLNAIDLNPHDPHLWSFHHDLSEAHFALGNLSDAERATRAAAQLPNATHWPWVTLASVLGTRNRAEEAQAALHELMRRRPDYSLATARSEMRHLADTDFVHRYLDGLKRAGLPL